MNEPAHIRPLTGTQVVTADGKALGHIGAVRGDYFRVDEDETMQRWFETARLGSAQNGDVAVAFDYDDVNTYVVDPPTDDSQSEYLDSDLTPEQEETRDLMLRQLAEQRERMRVEGNVTPEAEATVGQPVEQELERRTGEAAG
jgi:hypothetical protein